MIAGIIATRPMGCCKKTKLSDVRRYVEQCEIWSRIWGCRSRSTSKLQFFAPGDLLCSKLVTKRHFCGAPVTVMSMTRINNVRIRMEQAVLVPRTSAFCSCLERPALLLVTECPWHLSNKISSPFCMPHLEGASATSSEVNEILLRAFLGTLPSARTTGASLHREPLPCPLHSIPSHQQSISKPQGSVS